MRIKNKQSIQIGNYFHGCKHTSRIHSECVPALSPFPIHRKTTQAAQRRFKHSWAANENLKWLTFFSLCVCLPSPGAGPVNAAGLYCHIKYIYRRGAGVYIYANAKWISMQLARAFIFQSFAPGWKVHSVRNDAFFYVKWTIHYKSRANLFVKSQMGVFSSIHPRFKQHHLYKVIWNNNTASSENLTFWSTKKVNLE